MEITGIGTFMALISTVPGKFEMCSWPEVTDLLRKTHNGGLLDVFVGVMMGTVGLEIVNFLLEIQHFFKCSSCLGVVIEFSLIECPNGQVWLLIHNLILLVLCVKM